MNSIKRNSPATPGGMDMDNKDTIASMEIIFFFSIKYPGPSCNRTFLVLYLDRIHMNSFFSFTDIVNEEVDTMDTDLDTVNLENVKEDMETLSGTQIGALLRNY